jgi:hypothetical protein
MKDRIASFTPLKPISLQDMSYRRLLSLHRARTYHPRDASAVLRHLKRSISDEIDL